MNSPEEANANVHPSDDAQSTGSVDANSDMSVDEQIPTEIAEARALLETALSNLVMAEGAYETAAAEAQAAENRAETAHNAQAEAETAEYKARRAYVDALRRHGYVQTADGPKPRQS